ncbi:CaiB/BaiF CoA-transferase family protein [Cumulibacter manganitolerans]|uniref:CaiB/BaiF CoA-transferase family protein n=1 Tax=Cumulibacter manganitolerans TaxID=1884992 RepID=UPI0018861971|nr:CoA transferase [Cumulibacter manganitolerans]
MTHALDGLRVLDLSTAIAPAVTSMLLADYGADVVRVEDADRPSRRDDPGFATWDRNKRLVRVSGDRSETLAALVAAADLVITGRAPDEVVSAADLEAMRSSASAEQVLLAMPPFLDSCPWASARESNELLSAALGISLRQSSATDRPIDPVYRHILYLQGVWAATCALSALRRAESGGGQTVTVGGAHAAAIAGCATSVVDPDNLTITPPAGNGGPNATYTPYQCADGEWLFVGALTPKFQHAFFALLGIADLVDDPRIAGDLDAILLQPNRGWVRERIADVLRTRDRDDWLARLHEVGVPAGPVLDRAAWLDHPQVRAIGMAVEVADPCRGEVLMPGIPMALERTPGAIRTAASSEPVDPSSLGWSDRPASTAPGRSAETPTGEGPFAGLRVLDLGTVLAGPLAGSLLAELGADVIKVEPPAGDPFRTKGFMYNRGMRSLSVDLRSADGRELFCDLAREADVVIDNFRPGVLDRLGIDYATLSGLNPGIITVSFTGYGEAGPLRAEPGFDPVLQAMSGMMRAQGGDGDPVFLTMAVNDIASAVLGTFAAAVALYHRGSSGHGQRVTGSLAATSVFMQSGELTRIVGRPAARVGGPEYPGPDELDRLYAARDGWIRLQCAAADRGRLTALVGEDLEAGIAAQERDPLLARLRERGIDAAAAPHPNELIEATDLIDRELIQEQTRPNGRPYFAPGRLAWFERTQRSGASGPPGLGEHSAEIAAAAGRSAADIDRLVVAGVVVAGEPMALDNFVSYR